MRNEPDPAIEEVRRVSELNNQVAVDTMVVRAKAEEYAKSLLYDIARLGPMSDGALELVTDIMLNLILTKGDT